MTSSEASSSNQYLALDIGMAMMGSESSLRKILKTVETSLSANIPEIWKALEEDNIAVANRLLHGIKGYVPIFCTEPLVDQVTQTEVLSKTEPAAAVKPLFALLAPKLESLLVEIRAYVAQGPA
ncbi:hypothetical protein [Rhodoferax sp.]|uniref:hypothetical protein n=1 Tax=Rhodoferax sp. TaxID=50421 RepID=UPI001EC9ACB0|nr:hypothetical protein [Rhodoferax sp.]MBT9507507.1 hypothetical protein [Rhodoferax sp.]